MAYGCPYFGSYFRLYFDKLLVSCVPAAESDDFNAGQAMGFIGGWAFRV